MPVSLTVWARVPSVLGKQHGIVCSAARCFSWLSERPLNLLGELLNSLGLNFLICEMEMAITLILWSGFGKDINAYKLAVHTRRKVPGWVRDNPACSFSLVFLLEPHSSPIFPVSLQLYWGRAPVLSGTVNEVREWEVSFMGRALLCSLWRTHVEMQIHRMMIDWAPKELYGQWGHGSCQMVVSGSARKKVYKADI